MISKGVHSILFGMVLILSSLVLVAYNTNEANRAARSSEVILNSLFSGQTDENHDFEVREEYGNQNRMDGEQKPTYILHPEIEMPVTNIDGIDYIGMLYIPTLGLHLPIGSQWSYENLKYSPCRYSGSAYQGNFVLCAHNYDSHFGNIKSLQPGDLLFFTDIDGNEFKYEVAVQEILSPTATEDMESGDWNLTLFTCTLGGESRVTLRCILLTE